MAGDQGNDAIMFEKIKSFSAADFVIKLAEKNRLFYWIAFWLILFAYGLTLKNDFMIDDYKFIVDWPLIQNLSNFPLFFSHLSQPLGEEGVYSPLKTLFHAVNYQLWGLNPVGYHVIAVIIHCVGTAFIFGICKQLTDNRVISSLSALFFSILPVHVEAITFLTASIDTLGVVFMLASFYYFLKYENETEGKSWAYARYIIFGAFAIFTHELTIILPLLCLLHNILYSERKILSSKNLMILPVFLILIVYVGLKAHIFQTVSRGGYLYGSFYLTMLVVLKAFIRYIYVLCLPFQLSINPELSTGIFSVDWQYFNEAAVKSQTLLDPIVVISMIVHVSLLWLAWIYRKKSKLITFAIGWYFICLLPVSNIIPTGCYYAERYLYAASLGYCLLLGIIFEYLLKKNRVISNIGVSILVSLMIVYLSRTISRNQDWNNEYWFLTSEVEANPTHPLMQRDLGILFLRNKELDKAEYHLNKSLEYQSMKDYDVTFALGQVYAEQKKFDKAIQMYRQTLVIKPDFPEVYYNLAGVYAYSGNFDEANAFLNTSVKLYEQLGEHETAIEARKLFNEYFSGENP